MVCDDDRVVLFDCLIGDGAGQVDGEEDRVLVAWMRWDKGSFDQETGVVKGLVGQRLGIELAHRGDHGAGKRRDIVLGGGGHFAGEVQVERIRCGRWG